MIYYNIPWNTQKNLGKAYNNFMKMLPGEKDFACFIDADASFTTYFFGKQIEQVIEAHPECGVFTAMTNRVGCTYQIQPGVNPTNNDMAYHRAMGEKVWNENLTRITDISNVPRGTVMSGVLILIRKDIWQDIGGFKEDGMLGIDSDLHWRCMDHAQKVYLMRGVYLYHWYRNNNRTDKKHLL